jgi:hypothetical protein
MPLRQNRKIFAKSRKRNRLDLLDFSGMPRNPLAAATTGPRPGSETCDLFGISSDRNPEERHRDIPCTIFIAIEAAGSPCMDDMTIQGTIRRAENSNRVQYQYRRHHFWSGDLNSRVHAGPGCKRHRSAGHDRREAVMTAALTIITAAISSH